MNESGLYLVITDPVTSYEQVAEAAVRANVKIIQLRMKHEVRAEIVRTAHALRAITRSSNTLFIVNDDPSIAAETEADGVHVGQTDMSIQEIRTRYPSIGIVGLSTHSLAQARGSVDIKPDYIGAGPVWATPTKETPDPTLGVSTAVQIVRSVPFPAVAIGGIDAGRLPGLIHAGVRSFAVVRAVCQSKDPYSAIRRLQDIYENSLDDCRQ